VCASACAAPKDATIFSAISRAQSTFPDSELTGQAARDNDVHLVVGMIERDAGTLYCTALMYRPEGHLLGKHRNLMPTALEHPRLGLRRRLDGDRRR
jgi:predicted amidohydrolase